jgi:hypothetical protein
VVKSLRNWARAQARTAERRGRFEGSKEVGVAVADDVVLVASATVITSSIHQYHSLSLSLSLSVKWDGLGQPGQEYGLE